MPNWPSVSSAAYSGGWWNTASTSDCWVPTRDIQRSPYKWGNDVGTPQEFAQVYNYYGVILPLRVVFSYSFSDGNIYLGDELDDDAIDDLSQLGLYTRFSRALDKWTSKNRASDAKLKAEPKDIDMESKLREHRGQLEVALESRAIQIVLDVYKYVS